MPTRAMMQAGRRRECSIVVEHNYSPRTALGDNNVIWGWNLQNSTAGQLNKERFERAREF